MNGQTVLLIAAVIAIAALVAGRSDWHQGGEPESALEISWRFCPPSGPRITCVVDCDTFWIAGEKVRIANIDTPERGEPGFTEAGRSLIALLSAGPVRLDRDGTDRYGRTLALVSANGNDVGAALVADGLARVWE